MDKDPKKEQIQRSGRCPSPYSPSRPVSPTRVSPVTLRDYKARMLRVLVYIQQHLDQPLRLEDLAAIARFSPHHFHRVFKGMLGEPVKEHIRRLRLERAACQLKLFDKPIVQIALDAGYETPESFTRSFKTAFGVAPSQFRSFYRLRNPLLHPTRSKRFAVHYREGKTIENFKTMRLSKQSPEITIKTIPQMRVAFVRHVGPYSGCHTAWEKLCTFMGKEGHLGSQTRFIGLSHDDPEVTPEDKIRYDACITVDDSFQGQGEIGTQIIPSGDYAVTTHFGPYQKLNHTYARIMGQWLPRSGRELGNSSCFEVYLNDPDSTDPEDLITDVYVPLKPLPGV